MPRSKALLYYQFNPPADNEAAFVDYYDEHQARRMGMPGFLNARRYQLAEGEGPRFLATYDIEDASALQSPEYLALRAEENASARDTEMLGSVEIVARRLYRNIDTDEPWAAAWTDHAPYVMSVGLEPPPDPPWTVAGIRAARAAASRSRAGSSHGPRTGPFAARSRRASAPA